MKLDTRKTKDAVFLIDDMYCTSPKNRVPSGWDLDYRGHEEPKDPLKTTAHNMKTSESGKYPLTFARTFMVLSEGKASLVHTVHIKGGDGYFLELYSTDGKTALSIQQKQGFFHVNDKKTDCVAEYKTYTINFELDIDNRAALLVVNGKCFGSYPILGNDLYKIKHGYKAGSIGESNAAYTGLMINYLVCDKNFVRYDMDMPYGWQDLSRGTGSASTSFYYEGQNLYTYRLCSIDSSPAKAAKSFDKTYGKAAFEVKYFTKNDGDENVKISFTCEGKECVSVTDNGSSLCDTNGNILRSHHPFTWQRVRIDADINTGKALIWLNGKKTKEISFDSLCEFFDGILISYAPKNGGVMKFTDVFVFPLYPEPDDYPKAPVMPTKKYDIYTGMNICSLWREGTHYGWENIVNFPENMPLLGPYDEGITEVADWEIKFMAEHGLDCQFYCWYCKQHNAPILKTALSFAMEYGHMYAKYSDKVKFALLWEAGNSTPLTSVEEFKNYYVPYWIDNFFSDDRYFRIDGVAIMAVFGLARIVKELGSTEKTKECLDYLRSELKKIGYKGLAVITNTQPCDQSVNSGTDAAYAYHWGYMGHNPEHQKSSILGQMASGRLHVTPTLSVGYNDIAWRVADRVPYISLENMRELLQWMIKDILGSYSHLDEAWKRKLLMFSTWNEYGEGTFISPAGLNGFGYLNEMRKALTVEGNALDSELPTKNAYERLGYLFPRGKKLLCTPQTIPLTKPDTVVAKIDFSSKENVEKVFKNMKFVNCQGEFTGGKLCGQSTAYDPQINFDVDFDAADVDAIVIKMRSAEESFDKSKMIDKPTTCRIFYATDEYPELSWEKSGSPTLIPETVLVSKQKTWHGRVKTMRLDPTNGNGVYEIESITFLKNSRPNIETYVDGVLYDSHYQPKSEDGEVYVSFEPLRDFHRYLNIYYEWDDETKTLMLDYDGKKYFFTEGKSHVKCDNGGINLKKPLEFYDGLPYIPMSALEKITCCKYTYSEGKLEITTM